MEIILNLSLLHFFQIKYLLLRIQMITVDQHMKIKMDTNIRMVIRQLMDERIQIIVQVQHGYQPMKIGQQQQQHQQQFHHHQQQIPIIVNPKAILECIININRDFLSDKYRKNHCLFVHFFLIIR